MSLLLDEAELFTRPLKTFAEGHGVTTTESRTWEKAYRGRWQHRQNRPLDPARRELHRLVLVEDLRLKGGIVTWETQ